MARAWPSPDLGPGCDIARSRSRAELWVVGGGVAFLAGFALVAVLAGGGETVLARIAALDVQLVAGLLGLSLVNYAVRAVRWQIFSRQVGVNLPWTASGLYYVAGFAMAVTPGKVGEVLRLWLLHRGHGYRYERTAGMLVADKLSDAGALLLLCLLGASAFAGYGWTALGLGAVVLAATALCLRPHSLIALLGWTYGRFQRWPRLFGRARTALRRLALLASWRVYGGTLLLVSLGWFAEASALYWLLLALGSPVPLVQAVFIFTFAMLAGTAAMLPGGLGGTEAGMIGLLSAVGVEFDVAVAATAVVRVTTLWFAVALGFLALPLALRAVSRAAASAARAGAS